MIRDKYLSSGAGRIGVLFHSLGALQFFLKNILAFQNVEPYTNFTLLDYLVKCLFEPRSIED